MTNRLSMQENNDLEQKSDFEANRVAEGLSTRQKIMACLKLLYFLPACLNLFRMLCSKDSNDAFGNR
jgi:hypothetical protein